MHLLQLHTHKKYSCICPWATSFSSPPLLPSNPRHKPYKVMTQITRPPFNMSSVVYFLELAAIFLSQLPVTQRLLKTQNDKRRLLLCFHFPQLSLRLLMHLALSPLTSASPFVHPLSTSEELCISSWVQLWRELHCYRVGLGEMLSRFERPDILKVHICPISVTRIKPN